MGKNACLTLLCDKCCISHHGRRDFYCENEIKTSVLCGDCLGRRPFFLILETHLSSSANAVMIFFSFHVEILKLLLSCYNCLETIGKRQHFELDAYIFILYSLCEMNILCMYMKFP